MALGDLGLLDLAEGDREAAAAALAEADSLAAPAPSPESEQGQALAALRATLRQGPRRLRETQSLEVTRPARR